MDDKITDIEQQKKIISVGGKEYEIKYTLGAMKFLAHKHGSAVEALNKFGKVNISDLTEEAIDLVCDVIYAGITDKKITREEFENEIDMAEIIEALPVLTETLIESMPEKKVKGVTKR